MKDKVNFESYDVTTWETIVIQLLSNISRSKMQSGNEIWSVNRIQREKHSP